MQEDSSVGRYFIKSDSQGKPGLTDQVHLIDDWLRTFWAGKLDPSKSPWLEDLVKINMLQENVQDTVFYKGHKLDFRLYFIVEGVVKGIPNVKAVGGFGRVAVKAFDGNSLLDVSLG